MTDDIQYPDTVTKLRLYLLPESCVDDGVRWRIKETHGQSGSPWLTSGAIANAKAGLCEVELKIPEPAAWYYVNNIGGTKIEYELERNQLNENQITLSAMTNVQVIIHPNECDVEWRPIYTKEWKKSGDIIEIGGSAKPYIDLEFRPIEGWENKGRVRKYITIGKMNVIHADFKKLSVKSQLKINLYPEEIRSKVYWRRVGTRKWIPSGEIDTNALSGHRIIEFSDLEGYIKPDNQEVYVDDKELLTYDFYYSVPTEVYVRIGITPGFLPSKMLRDHVPLPKWRFFGSSEWINFGVRTKTYSGSRSIELTPVPGWKCPRYIHCLIDEEGNVTYSKLPFYDLIGYTYVMCPTDSNHDVIINGPYGKANIVAAENMDVVYVIRWIAKNEHGYSESTREYYYNLNTTPSDIVVSYI